MVLWTVQPQEVYEILVKNGSYRCDAEKMDIPEFQKSYDWLVEQMIKRIGPPPQGVRYPVWAWHTYEGERKRLDLRKVRWTHGGPGDKLVCMEIDIPDNEVVLSDFDAWHCVLNDYPILDGDNEEEWEARTNEYDALPEEEQARIKVKSWEKVFDTEYFDNCWDRRGYEIQATFWELRMEQVRNVRFFEGAVKPQQNTVK